MSHVPLKDGTVLTFTANYQQFNTTGGWVPDPSWEYTDEAGHTHFYDRGSQRYPSLRRRYRNYWCADCRDHHETFLGYFCRACEEKIEPAQKFNGPETIIATGLVEYRRTGWLTVPLEEGRKLFTNGKATKMCSWGITDTYISVYVDELLTEEQAKALLDERMERRQA